MKNLDDVVKDIEIKNDLSKIGKFTDLPPASLDDVKASFADLLYLDDDSTIKITLAAFLANRFDTLDPVWLFLVAPSASAKTEFVNALDKVPGTFMFSSITPNTFLSGMKNAKSDPSLLLRLDPRVTFLQKDFTTILSMRSEVRSEILGQLREIYDGKLYKDTGTGVSKRWEGKVGFISGVTLEIEEAIMDSTRFGDRFLYWRLPAVDERSAMRKVSANRSKAGEYRKAVQEKVAAYLGSVVIPDVIPEHTQEFTDALAAVCIFVVSARTCVKRDRFGSKDVLESPLAEGPNRFYKELEAVATAMLIMNQGPLTDADYLLITKLAFDAIPRRRHSPIRYLYRSADWRATTDVASEAHVPPRTAHYILDDLEVCGIVERKKKDGSKDADEWRMTATMKGLMNFLYDPSGTSAPKVPMEEAMLPVAGKMEDVQF